jgi:hypothetical protein
VSSRDLDLPRDDAIDLPAGVATTEVGMSFTADVRFAEWEQLGRRLGRAHSAVQWWIGDWLVFGEARFGEMYEQALQETGRSRGGLMNLKSVAKQLQPSVRRSDLSWSHHRQVMSLPSGDQREWLERAAAEGWSVDLLGDVLRAEGVLTTRLGLESIEPSPAEDKELISLVRELRTTFGDRLTVDRLRGAVERDLLHEGVDVDAVNQEAADPDSHWVDLPLFISPPDSFRFVVACDSENDRSIALDRLGIRAIAKRTNGVLSVRWPPREREDLSSLRFERGGDV